MVADVFKVRLRRLVLSRNDSVGSKVMVWRILSQDEARARSGPIEGP